jgi:hypothetical protein
MGSRVRTAVAGLSDEEVDAVCKVAADEVMIELREQRRVLRDAIDKMDQAKEERESGDASVKFKGERRDDRGLLCWTW